MSHSLKIESNDEKISITSADGAVLVDVPSIILLDSLENIISIGVTPETIQKDSPDEWETIKSQLHFCNPFSIDDFHPDLAARTINRLIFWTIHPTPDSILPFWKRLFIKDITEWQLTIARYEKLPKKNQELFEYYAQKTGLVKVGRLAINGRVREIEKIRWAENSLVFGVTTLSSLIFLVMFGIMKFFEPFINEQWQKIQTRTNDSIPLIIFVVCVLFIFSFSSFICSLIWKISATKSISASMARIIMEETKMGLPKPIMNFLWHASFSQKKQGLI